MMTTRTTSRPGVSTRVLNPVAAAWLDTVCPALSEAVAQSEDHLIAAAVGDVLLADLPEPADLLTPRQRAGDADRYRQNVLAAASDGSFSIAALVWRPGQRTSVHDHLCWCVVAVLQGQEHEVRYELDEDRAGVAGLRATAQLANRRGSVSAAVPPGDIHRVGNVSDGVVVSLHVYGADISASGSSIRRVYRA